MQDIQISHPEDQNAFLHFIVTQWRVLAILIVAVLLAVAGYSYYQHVRQQAKVQAENNLGLIIATKTGPDRMAALEDFLKTAPSSIKDAVLLEIARTSMDQGKFDKAAQAWGELAKTAPEGMRTVAAIGEATTLAQTGEKEKAVKLLVDLLPKAPQTFQLPVARQLASLAEDAQMYPEAAAAYERLKEAAGSAGNKAFYDTKIADLKSKIK